MKKMTKKNNKGFSLVELIVVVLIMGIIAVALAPQVMKWVENSKINTDRNNCATIKSSVQAAIANYQAKGGKIGTDNVKWLIKGSAPVQPTGSSDAVDWTESTLSLKTEFADVTGGDYPNTKYDGDGFIVTITGGTGKVEVSCGASASGVSIK